MKTNLKHTLICIGILIFLVGVSVFNRIPYSDFENQQVTRITCNESRTWCMGDGNLLLMLVICIMALLVVMYLEYILKHWGSYEYIDLSIPKSDIR